MTPWSCGGSSTVSSARRSEEHTSELQSQSNLVCRLLLAKKTQLLEPHRPALSTLPSVGRRSGLDHSLADATPSERTSLSAAESRDSLDTRATLQLRSPRV